MLAMAPQLVAQSEAKLQEPTRPAPKPVPAEAGRMTVSGRVLDLGGKPFAGTMVDVIGRPRIPWIADNKDRVNHSVLLGGGKTDGNGEFHIETPRTGSGRFFAVYALSAAPGSAPAWAELNPDADKPAAEIHLRPEHLIRGKLVDLNGQPVAAVELRVGAWAGPTIATSEVTTGCRSATSTSKE